MGPRIVLATSIELAEDDPGRISMIGASDHGSWLVSTPRLELAAVSGSGDLTAALFLAHLLDVDDVATALGRTASSVFGVLEATAQLGGTEMALVEAQDEIADPIDRFDVIALH